MRYVLGILLLIFLVWYVVPNVFRYPWHTAAFVVAGIALSVVVGGGRRLTARLHASAHPGARRLAAAHAVLAALFAGTPPYGEGRWWIVRTLVQAAFWALILAVALAVIVALGGVFNWLDTQ